MKPYYVYFLPYQTKQESLRLQVYILIDLTSNVLAII